CRVIPEICTLLLRETYNNLGRISSILVHFGFHFLRNQNAFQYLKPFPSKVPFPEIVNPSTLSAFTRAGKYFTDCPSILVSTTLKSLISSLPFNFAPSSKYK